MRYRFFFMFILLISRTLEAGSFSANKFYEAQGRIFFQNEKPYLKINEGTGNEEVLELQKTKLDVADKEKHQVCFKIIECAEGCKAQLIKTKRILKPWEEAAPLHMNTKGEYPAVPEKSCSGERT